jgi:hypothetical protein
MARSEEQMVQMGLKPDVPFEEWQKIHRYNRSIVITEKIDGTNAQVYINDTGDRAYAGSRTKWISVEDDNYGFARWVADNHDDLLALGPGKHYGEWWGAGIQRRYGMTHKKFSLFNTARWTVDTVPRIKNQEQIGVVPVLHQGLITQIDVLQVLDNLRTMGSVAAPGFMNPEGIVVYHTPSRNLYKMTLDKNDEHKGAAGGA